MRKIVGRIAVLLLMYLLLQGVFTLVVAGGFLGYSIAEGRVTIEQLANVGNAERVSDIPGLEGYAIDVMAIGLFLSASCMLLFIHLTKFFRLRMSLFSSIAFKPLIISALFVFCSMFALNIIVQFFPLEDNLSEEFYGLTHNFLGAFTISILGPILEEVMFRGAIQGYMMRRFRSPWIAIAIAALIFGIFHMNPVQIAYAALLGVVFGWIYYRTGSLMYAIVGHVLNNSVATLLMICFGKSNETELLEGFSPFAENVMSVIVAVVFALLAISLAVRLCKMFPTPPVPWHDSDEPVQALCTAAEPMVIGEENIGE